MMKVKQGSEEFLKPFLIVSQHREIAGIFLFSGFIPALTGCHFKAIGHFCSVAFFPAVFLVKLLVCLRVHKHFEGDTGMLYIQLFNATK